MSDKTDVPQFPSFKTEISDDEIKHLYKNGMGKVIEHTMKLQESATRNALKTLGWISPNQGYNLYKVEMDQSGYMLHCVVSAKTINDAKRMADNYYSVAVVEDAQIIGKSLSDEEEIVCAESL